VRGIERRALERHPTGHGPGQNQPRACFAVHPVDCAAPGREPPAPVRSPPRAPTRPAPRRLPGARWKDADEARAPERHLRRRCGRSGPNDSSTRLDPAQHSKSTRPGARHQRQRRFADAAPCDQPNGAGTGLTGSRQAGSVALTLARLAAAPVPARPPASPPTPHPSRNCTAEWCTPATRPPPAACPVCFESRRSEHGWGGAALQRTTALFSWVAVAQCASYATRLDWGSYADRHDRPLRCTARQRQAHCRIGTRLPNRLGVLACIARTAGRRSQELALRCS